MLSVFVGYDPREKDAYTVARSSITTYNKIIPINGVYLPLCEELGLYKRPTCVKEGVLHDVISNAPMATEFALTRFLIPWIAMPESAEERDGWVLFVDCDVLIRCDLDDLLDLTDDKYAVMCVKHDLEHGTGTKMDGQEQTSYPRKNWSSVMLWNLKHPANYKLTLGMVNTFKGLLLHQFCWLKDEEIGELPVEWNHLVGLMPENADAKIVHYTLGIPSMKGYENCEHSEEWHATNLEVEK